MIAVNIRELTHNFSKYLKSVKAGDRIIIMERNVPIAEIIPHNADVTQPGWKRKIKRVKIEEESLSDTIVKNRREEPR